MWVLLKDFLLVSMGTVSYTHLESEPVFERDKNNRRVLARRSYNLYSDVQKGENVVDVYKRQVCPLSSISLCSVTFFGSSGLLKSYNSSKVTSCLPSREVASRVKATSCLLYTSRCV